MCQKMPDTDVAADFDRPGYILTVDTSSAVCRLDLTVLTRE